jgi:DNA-directed RNA polymerase specialized sigma24 family protein
MSISRRRAEVLGLEPELRRWAARYTADANLAHALVHHTLMAAFAPSARHDDHARTRAWAAARMRETAYGMDCFRPLRPALSGSGA